MKNHYDTLGIDRSADARQIKRAYFGLVKQFPPERFPEKFKEIRAAYDALSDEDNRAKYDEFAALPDNAAFLCNEARKAWQHGRADNALEIYTMLVKNNPELPIVWAEYARLLEAIGKTGKAIDAWKELCAMEPDNVEYIIALADCYDMRGWRKKAIGTYNRALEIDGSSIKCWEALIECHLDAGEREDVAAVTNRAIAALEKEGKESIYIYACAIGFCTKGDPALIEGLLKDILRVVHTGVLDAKEVQVTALFVLTFLIEADLMCFFPHVREMVDTLPALEDSIRERISFVELMYETGMLEEKGYNPLFHDLFMVLRKGCGCENCRMEIAAMECNVLIELDTFRPQIVRLRNEYPHLYAMHSAFFNEVVRTRDPDKMLHHRMKSLAKHGFGADLFPDEPDEYGSEVQQTVRRDGPKIGRNDPCPCGSGKKYKKCCGA